MGGSVIIGRRLIGPALVACLSLSLFPCISLEASDFNENPEQLLFMDIPSVIAASRKEQLTTEAPASVEVITAEEIR